MQLVAQTRQDRPSQGIAMMTGGMLLLTAMDVCVKLIVEAHLEPVQLIAVRGWVMLALMLAILPWAGGLGTIKTSRPIPMLARGVFGFLAPFSFFTALQTVPLAEAMVIFFAAPIIMTAMSALLLKEAVGPYRWGAVLAGFVGVVIAINPSPTGFDPTLLLVIVATFTYASLFLVGRWLSDTESTFGLVFYFNLGMTIVASLAMPFLWQPLTIELIAGIVTIACLALTGHFLVTQAFVSAPLGIVAPFEYTALLWGVLFSYLVWGDLPAQHVWIGAAIIIGSGLVIVYRENKARKQAASVVDGQI